MSDIKLPPEVVEAAARAVLRAVIYDIEPDVRANGMTNDEYRTIATAALRAAINAWPNQHDVADDVVYILNAIILPLPLPQEAGE